MERVVISVHKKDIRRIRITCRCGTQSIAEIPQPIARALNLYPCPGCGTGYTITQLPDRSWKIARMEETVDKLVITDAS